MLDRVLNTSLYRRLAVSIKKRKIDPGITILGILEPERIASAKNHRYKFQYDAS